MLVVDSVADALARPLYVRKHALDLRSEEDEVNPAWMVGAFFLLLAPIFIFGETTAGREVKVTRRLKRIDALELEARGKKASSGGVTAVPTVAPSEVRFLYFSPPPISLACK